MKKVTARAIGEMNEDKVAASITELACEHVQKNETRRGSEAFRIGMSVGLVRPGGKSDGSASEP